MNRENYPRPLDLSVRRAEHLEIYMIERSILLIELENHLSQAAKALRTAWHLCKHNGMEPTAKELAVTVLDVEAAYQQVKDERAT